MIRIKQYVRTSNQNKGIFIVILLLVFLCISCSNGGSDENLPPVLSRLSPAAATAGSSELILTLGGSGFAQQSTVSANNLELDTTYMSETELTARLPTELLATSGMLELSVSQAAFGNGATAALPFTIVATGAVNPTNHPQVATYSINVPRDAQVTIEFHTPGQQARRTWSQPTPLGGGDVSLFVAGMLAFTTYSMHAIIEFPDGTSHVDVDKEFTTGGPPPERTPGFAVTKSDMLTPNPGVQLFDLIGNDHSQAVVTDLDGNIIWFHEIPLQSPLIIRRLSNGHFLINGSTLGEHASPLQEIDLAGNVVRETTASEINNKLVSQGMEPVAAFIHHDVIMLPNGHLMLLTAYDRILTDLDDFVGQEISVVGDSLVELDENFDPVWSWSSFDHLDVNRSPFAPPDPPNGFDWTHGNALTYAAADGNLILSLRHQNWVVKIDYQDGLGTGDVLWRLGLEGDFDLMNAGPEGWQYAQHAPFLLDEQIDVFRLAVWDNGNFRVLDEQTGATCDPDVLGDCFSRAVIYEINEISRAVHIVWEDKLDIFSPFVGNIQVFNDGNVMWNTGVIAGATNAIVREVTQEAPPQFVWQAEVNGLFIYRTTRLPSLYPGVQW